MCYWFILNEPTNFYHPPNKVGTGDYGVASDVRLSVRSSVGIYFAEQISEAHGGGGDFYHIAHTHSLGGVDIPFGVYDL